MKDFPLAVWYALSAPLMTLLSACASSKPPPDQIFLMPAPAVYSEARISPLPDETPLGRGFVPCTLYATDRAPSADRERFAHYSDERGKVVRVGEACVEPAGDNAVSWEEVRRVSLLKNRSANYPLKIKSVDEYGVLERTVPPFVAGVARSPVPGRRFADAIDERLGASSKRDVYIYVHGYKVEFENPILVATELWNFLGYRGAFIAYSWPSTRETLAYWSDLDDAANAARGLRMLITYVAEHTEVERIHVIGYSAGTQLVARMLADMGMFGRFLDEADIRKRAKLGHVILVGSDVDRDVLGGYVLDGALRIPMALTVYQSSADTALDLSRWVFRRSRAGQTLLMDGASDVAMAFLRHHPNLLVVDVTNAEGGTAGSGHSYLRDSPWVSSDVLLTLLFDLGPTDRGLVPLGGGPVWTFPDDYTSRLNRTLLRLGLRPADDGAPLPARREITDGSGGRRLD